MPSATSRSARAFSTTVPRRVDTRMNPPGAMPSLSISRGFKPAIASGSMASRLDARRVMEPVCQCSSSLPVVSTSG